SAQSIISSISFFFNQTPTTAPYTLSLHDALPISLQRHHLQRVSRSRLGLLIFRRRGEQRRGNHAARELPGAVGPALRAGEPFHRSEEHTSELQSRGHLVCRLLLEKKKTDK